MLLYCRGPCGDMATNMGRYRRANLYTAADLRGVDRVQLVVEPAVQVPQVRGRNHGWAGVDCFAS
jgi:hypothetical protein